MNLREMRERSPRNLPHAGGLAALGLGLALLGGCEKPPTPTVYSTPVPIVTTIPTHTPTETATPWSTPTEIPISTEYRGELKRMMKDVAFVVDNYLNPGYTEYSVFIDNFRNPEPLTDDQLRPYVGKGLWTGAHHLGRDIIAPEKNYGESWEVNLGNDATQEFKIGLEYLPDGSKISLVSIGTQYISPVALEILPGFFEDRRGGVIKSQELAVVAQTVYQIPADIEFEFGREELGRGEGIDFVRAYRENGLPGKARWIDLRLDQSGSSRLWIDYPNQ